MIPAFGHRLKAPAFPVLGLLLGIVATAHASTTEAATAQSATQSTQPESNILGAEGLRAAVPRIVLDGATFVAMIGVIVALLQSRRAADANALGAWISLWDRLQAESIAAGRAIARYATWSGKERPSEGDLDKTWGKLKRHSFDADWFRELKGMNEKDRHRALLQHLRLAYYAFDMAGHALLATSHGRVIQDFVCAYADGITQCYERGRHFQTERAQQGRTELHEAITVLYYLAQRYRKLGTCPALRLNWWQRMRFPCDLRHARQNARRCIEKLGS